MYEKVISKLFTTQHIPTKCEQGYHIFSIIFSNKNTANKFIEFLKVNKITAKKHYTDLSSSYFSTKKLGVKKFCKVSKNLSDCLVRLPLHNELSIKEINHILNSIKRFKVI